MKVMIVAAILCLTAAAASADVYRCGGVWGNKPCDGETGSPVIRDRPARPAPQPATEARSLAAETPRPETPPGNLQSLTSDGIPYEQNVQMRMRSAVRSPLTFNYNVEEADFRRWKFQGRINGSGDARATLKYRYRDRWGRIVETKSMKTILFKLSDTGEERPFSFTIDKPTPNAIAEYEMTAEYVGKWNGSLDLRGCCENDGGAICLRGGEVRCAQGSISTRCRCSD